VDQRNDRTWKPEKESGNALERSLRSFQEYLKRAGPIAAASYALIGAIILLGLIGYGIDRWLGTFPWFLLGGLLLGIIVGFYDLAKTIWKQ
jgi:F0F1-type ATP synthase assembly protein I